MSQKKKFTATQAEFHNFTQFINAHMIKNHGFQYLGTNDKGGQWREKIPYSVDTEQELLSQTSTFLNMMISNRSDSKNPHFLASLIKSIADFLSKYIAKGPEYKCRKQATQALIKIISDKNYTLKSKQAQQESTSVKTETKHRRKRIMVKNSYKQINDLFDEMQREIKFYRKR